MVPAKGEPVNQTTPSGQTRTDPETDRRAHESSPVKADLRTRGVLWFIRGPCRPARHGPARSRLLRGEI